VGLFLRWGFALNACRILQTCDAKECVLCSKSHTPAMDGCTAMLHMSDRASKLEEVAVGILIIKPTIFTNFSNLFLE